MNSTTRASFWTIIFGLILLISVGSVSAQKSAGPVGPVGVFGPLSEDTAINPHDFTNEYYEMNGIVGKAILGRRTGSDGLSIFSKSSNPNHTDVRVIATIPAYDQNGEMLFWYALGEIPDYGFSADKIGAGAREMAKLFPLYVFPHSKLQDPRLFANTRQAALIDNTWLTITDQDLNPLGFREIVSVRYTEKAFTDEGSEMMQYMEKKNGIGADDTPIIRNLDDLRTMMKHELISLAPMKGLEGPYAIAPMIYDPTNGVIAKDAYLWFATKDGTPLPSESMIARQFDCLQKTWNWCKQE